MTPKEKVSTHALLVFLAFGAIYIIWGSTYLLNKIAVEELPPFMLAGYRFSAAAILIFIWAIIRKKSLVINRQQFLNSLLAGFLFLSIGNGVVVWALRYLDSGFAALEISAQPLVILLMMWILQGKRIKPQSFVGVILGIIGMYLLVSQKQIIQQEWAWVGMIMIFFCMISWSYASLFVAKAELPKNFLVNTGYQMLWGGLLLLAMSAIKGEEWSSPDQWSKEVLWAMLLLVIFGSIVAFTSFNFLLRTVSPEKVATSTYVNPIVALLLGAYFLNEEVSFQAGLAAVILLSGVYFINSKKKIVLFSRFRSKKRLNEKKG